jgi:hypothetical protein
MCDYDIHDCECEERYGKKTAENNTPETDAQANLTGAGAPPTWHIHADFARRLERERDINRRLYETECKDHAFMRKTLERVIRERDKYQNTLKDIYTGHILRGAVQEKIEEALNFNEENSQADRPNGSV